ncbi:hypothetical protein FE236_04690 [Mariprofundus erugo]|uniref:PA2779 family protein n=1 Tax=Mariprofundus erugo TaxID=2528639 RepID=A0A5R9GPL6_9PROT|nr:PA2779 family protein [Mariprofundus erugo]TLS68236.1 hypothetical protein FEF65_04375 [Mariprofundus erugo]TLS77092.1 hypothetical protein FE236_04690 [Mariprofundus erugo]
MTKFFHKILISLLALSIISVNTGIPAAYAAMVPTASVIESSQAASNRAKVIDFLNRAEVQQELQQQGIEAEAAKARVARLDDREVAMLAGKIDTLPAGGFVGAVIGAAVFIFVVLLVTDILGFTDVFPFVHSHVRH